MLAKLLSNENPKILGHLTDGTAITGYTIKNSKGMYLNVLDYGATVTNLFVPVGEQFSDVVLGFNSVEDYIKSFEIGGSPYFGAIVGRVAGRIANAKFNLNNTAISINANFGAHQLHGGFEGFSQKIWEVKNVASNKITFYLLSKDGEEGYPGNLQTNLTYEITEENTWDIIIEAISDADTVVNFTQHSYFNLDDTAHDLNNHELKLQANQLLETNDMIPTGNFIDVQQSNYNFTDFAVAPTSIDTSFVNNNLNESVACLRCYSNNLQLTVFTNQPSTHVYVGGKVNDALVTKKYKQYNSYSGICFETQHFPDAVHHDNFPSIVLKKDEVFLHKTSYQFSTF
jgi:aldose 1-epimerase